jgi:hypothetical protein
MTLLSISANPPENPIGPGKPARSSLLDVMRQSGPALASLRITLRSLSSGRVLRGSYIAPTEYPKSTDSIASPAAALSDFYGL